MYRVCVLRVRVRRRERSMRILFLDLLGRGTRVSDAMYLFLAHSDHALLSTVHFDLHVPMLRGREMSWQKAASASHHRTRSRCRKRAVGNGDDDEERFVQEEARGDRFVRHHWRRPNARHNHVIERLALSSRVVHLNIYFSSFLFFFLKFSFDRALVGWVFYNNNQ